MQLIGNIAAFCKDDVKPRGELQRQFEASEATGYIFRGNSFCSGISLEYRRKVSDEISKCMKSDSVQEVKGTHKIHNLLNITAVDKSQRRPAIGMVRCNSQVLLVVVGCKPANRQ